MHLTELQDLDKLEIVTAERMYYQGLLNRRIDINGMLLDKIRSE